MRQRRNPKSEIRNPKCSACDRRGCDSMFDVRCSVFDVSTPTMKTPPFLLGAALLFWGWQADFLGPGAIMALILEGSRYSKLRWELSDQDFKRIWTFCALLFLAAAVYAFADSGGPEGFGRLFQAPSIGSEQEAGTVSARTAASLIRWLPFIFILFVASQAFSLKQQVPLHAISLILQWRFKKAKKRGLPPPPVQYVDVAYPYFSVCLLAASVHHSDGNNYFWGLCVLLAWALWVRRPQRFAVAIWFAAFVLAIGFGYTGARGIGFFQRYVENFNIQWFAEWLGKSQTDFSKSRTQFGQIGRIKTSPKIVIRLEPKSGQPPLYLREASYRNFRTPVWFSENRMLRNEFLPLEHATTNENTWRLLDAEKTNLASRVNIACFLEGRERRSGNSVGLLPLPTGSGRLENLAAYVLDKNSLGAVRAEGPGLVQFDALYGPGTTLDTAPMTNVPAFMLTNFDDFGGRTNRGRGAFDLRVPMTELPAVDQVVSNLNLRALGRKQALDIISQYFATNYTYRDWQDSDSKLETPLTRFLLETHAGHCEYFATATVLLLRDIGIPARYAVGYYVHEVSGKGYVVRQRDSHAWCLVWNEVAKTWEDFDTTPGSWLETDARMGGTAAWLSNVWWWIHFQFSKFRSGQTHLRQYILIGLVPLMGLLLFQIVRQRRRRLMKGTAAKRIREWPGLDSEFYQIEKRLTQRGIPRAPNEALGGWLERAAGEASMMELRPPLRTLLNLHYRYRFDPDGLNESDRDDLRRAARECLERLGRLETAKAEG